ncbi:MAG: hypothetical protein KGM24_14240 [Elusimicrobia bacterium]|nr:hypothetical protein [Elusimicrobiota bacterium]
MRTVAAGFLAGVVLYLVPGWHSGPACVAAGIAAAILVRQLGARSAVEKVGAVLTAALIAWFGGPRAGALSRLPRHLFGWFLAAGVLAYALRPRAE